MGESSQASDVEQLRAAYPCWQFGVLWITAATGPDIRRLWASRGIVFLSSWSADALAALVAGHKFPGDDAS
jgi:hypothetical protein